ncbi:sugar phosphate isomerase/epimerase [Ruminococcaceae bacterium OttesenSCG-928-I18]|nr:sugar phosphate isomerase/epimerase [Ruminococcaceae bacterium OttesenSCG-928-I18]
MRCGISTSCFFPEDTVLSLQQVVQMGSPVTEVFLNTFSEAEDAYIDRLCDIVKGSGTEVVSVHPFSSMLDGYFFASHYPTRFWDGLSLFKRYYEICGRLGANKLVFHGDHNQNSEQFSHGEYAEHFRTLSELGRQYGVVLCHENVHYCRLGDPANVRILRPMFGDAAAFTLDTKQVQRKKASLDEMLTAMGEDIRHVHISDFTPQKDCMLPGKGRLDFPALVKRLRSYGYQGDLIIELYQDGFTRNEELVEAMRYIQSLI